MVCTIVFTQFHVGGSVEISLKEYTINSLSKRHCRTEFLALSASEIAGAFIGAVLAWLVYLPHFNIVPEPPTVESLDPYAIDTLLNAGIGRHFSPTELNFASYNNNALDQYMRHHPAEVLESTVKDIGDLLRLAKAHIQIRREELEERLCRQLNEVQRIELERQLRDLEERSRTLDEHEMKAQMAQEALTRTQSDAGTSPDVMRSGVLRNSHADTEMGVVVVPPTKVSSTEQARYEAGLIADQNVKLGIFSTRPAIYMPIHNLVCEFICTVVLLICANMANARSNQLYEPGRGLFGSLFGIWLGFLVFLMILVIGGPTGLAANPARDLGPRIAHFLLPIPGKGPSEFLSYGWIPIIAPLAGGAAAGGLYLLLQKMNLSDVPAGSIVCAEAL